MPPGHEPLPGRLWEQAGARAAHALTTGALQPIPTQLEIVEQRGIFFLLRVVDNLARKRASVRASARTKTPANPFLPPDPDMVVGPVSETHLALLNKFNVLDDHLLIVTKSFEPQEALLDLADFSALAACLAEGEALGFYNGGTLAGASQAHKHLQLVPVPLTGEGPPALPIEPRLASVPGDERPHDADLPFRHGVVRWSGDGNLEGGQMLTAYRSLLAHTHSLDAPPAGAPSAPYNLLVTRRWMLLAPRGAERFQRVSINALGFAGAFLVSSVEEADSLKKRGLLEVLTAVARAR